MPSRWRSSIISRSNSAFCGAPQNAEFEREIIRERVKKGLAHARATGRIGGGRYKLSSDEQMEAIRLIRVEKKSQGVRCREVSDRSLNRLPHDDRDPAAGRVERGCAVIVARDERVSKSTISRMMFQGKVLTAAKLKPGHAFCIRDAYSFVTVPQRSESGAE